MDEFQGLAVMIDTNLKRVGIIVTVPGEDDEIVIDLSIDQARTVNRAINKAIDELEGRKEVIH